MQILQNILQQIVSYRLCLSGLGNYHILYGIEFKLIKNNEIFASIQQENVMWELIFYH